MRFFTIDIWHNNHFGSHDMAMLYWKLHYSKVRYNEIKLYMSLLYLVDAWWMSILLEKSLSSRSSCALYYFCDVLCAVHISPARLSVVGF